MQPFGAGDVSFLGKAPQPAQSFPPLSLFHFESAEAERVSKASQHLVSSLVCSATYFHHAPIKHNEEAVSTFFISINNIPDDADVLVRLARRDPRDSPRESAPFPKYSFSSFAKKVVGRA